MAFARRRLFSTLVALLFCTYAWSSEQVNPEDQGVIYLLGTKQLLEEIPSLQQTSFSPTLSKLYSIAQTLLAEEKPLLEELIKGKESMHARKRAILPHRSCVIKKRPFGKIKDVVVWELSLLLNGGSIICPALPFVYKDKSLIIQPFIDASVMDYALFVPSYERCATLSLLDYWKINILAYVLAIADMHGGNLPLTPSGELILWDNEEALEALNHADAKQKKDGRYAVHFFYANVLLDWPHFNIPLDNDTACALKEWIQGWDDVESAINTHWLVRHPLVSYDKRALFERLEKIRSFSLKEGLCFDSLFAHLFPHVAEGLEELVPLVCAITKAHVGPGGSLFFLRTLKDYYSISDDHQQKLNVWIERYFCSAPSHAESHHLADDLL